MGAGQGLEAFVSKRKGEVGLTSWQGATFGVEES